MKLGSSKICAVGVAAALALGSVAPASAAPWMASNAPAASSDLLIPVQAGETRRERREERRDTRQERREDRRDARQERREERREDRIERRADGTYYRGHRGFRDRRPGYRYYNGFWFPPAAFVLGAIIGGAVSGGPRVVITNAHVRWCEDRYRSYRVSDNTYQPINGPRRQCRSPY